MLPNRFQILILEQIQILIDMKIMPRNGNTNTHKILSFYIIF